MSINIIFQMWSNFDHKMPREHTHWVSLTFYLKLTKGDKHEPNKVVVQKSLQITVIHPVWSFPSITSSFPVPAIWCSPQTVLQPGTETDWNIHSDPLPPPSLNSIMCSCALDLVHLWIPLLPARSSQDRGIALHIPPAFKAQIWSFWLQKDGDNGEFWGFQRVVCKPVGDIKLLLIFTIKMLLWLN